MGEYLITDAVPEIRKDLKKIKVNNFDRDYSLFLKALPVMFSEKDFHKTHRIFKVANLGKKIIGEVYIAKKIWCKSLQSNSKFRFIFQVIDNKIKPIEIFFKSKKAMYDKQRILLYCQDRS